MRSSGPLRGSMRPTKPTTGPVASAQGVADLRRVELDRAVHDVHVEPLEAVGDGLGVGEHHVGAVPVARDAIDHVVDVQHGVAVAQRRQQPPGDRAVDVDHVEVLAQPPDARPRRDGASARAGRQPADVDYVVRPAGVRERALLGRGQLDVPAATRHPLGELEEAELRAARVVDLVDAEEPHARAARKNSRAGCFTFALHRVHDPEPTFLQARGRVEQPVVLEAEHGVVVDEREAERLRHGAEQDVVAEEGAHPALGTLEPAAGLQRRDERSRRSRSPRPCSARRAPSRCGPARGRAGRRASRERAGAAGASTATPVGHAHGPSWPTSACHAPHRQACSGTSRPTPAPSGISDALGERRDDERVAVQAHDVRPGGVARRPVAAPPACLRRSRPASRSRGHGAGWRSREPGQPRGGASSTSTTDPASPGSCARRDARRSSTRRLLVLGRTGEHRDDEAAEHAQHGTDQGLRGCVRVRVLIDTTFALRGHSGTGVYLEKLLGALGARASTSSRRATRDGGRRRAAAGAAR